MYMLVSIFIQYSYNIALVYYWIRILVHQYILVLMYYCITRSVRLCIIALVYDCISILLHEYVFVPVRKNIIEGGNDYLCFLKSGPAGLAPERFFVPLMFLYRST